VIYAVITLGAIIAFVPAYFYYRKKSAGRYPARFFMALPVFWILEFCAMFLAAYNKHGKWNVEKTDFPLVMTAILTGAALSAVAVLIIAYIDQAKTNAYGKKCLFTVKGIEFFPLNSLVYALAGLVLVVAAMFAIEIALASSSGLNRWNEDDTKINSMIHEKLKTDQEYPLVKVRGTSLEKDAKVKILVLGDSFIFGYGSANINYLWWNQLSGELARRGYDCAVYAAGYGGASTFDELQWLTTTPMLADLDPDIVIIGYVTNDAEYDPSSGGNYNHSGHYYGTLSQVVDIPLEKLFQKFLPNVFAGVDYAVTLKFSKLGFVQKRVGYQIADWEQKIVEGKMLSDYNSYVVEPLGRFAATLDIPVILVTTPHIPSIEYFEPKYKPVLPLFEKAGIRTFNLLDDFYAACSDKKYADNLAINPADSHPGTAGTWFYSKYIADLLEADYPDVLGEKTMTGKEVYNIEVNDWMPYSLSPKVVDEGPAAARYIVSYPAADSSESFLTMPVKKNYVRLNFKHPVDLSSVLIESEKLSSAELYVTGINEELGFDDQVFHHLGKKQGRVLRWADNTAFRVTSLCFNAQTSDGSAAELTVRIACKEGAVAP